MGIYVKVGNSSWDSQDVISIPLTHGGSAGNMPPEMTTLDPDAHALTEPVTVGGLAVAVTDWHNQAASGFDNLSVDALVTNLNKSSYIGNDGGDFVIGVKDTTGRVFEGLPDSTSESSFGSFHTDDAVLLAPGETASVRYVIAVPEDTADWELFVDCYGPHQRHASDPIYPSAVNSRAFWRLGPHPTELGIPSTLPGQLAPDVHPLGTSSQVGAFTVVVTDVGVVSKPGGDYNVQSPGTELTIQYRIQMTGTPPADYSPDMITANSAMQALVKNGLGHYFLPVGSTYSDTPMTSGATADLKTIFFVPDESTEYYLVLDYGFASQKAFFALK